MSSGRITILPNVDRFSTMSLRRCCLLLLATQVAGFAPASRVAQPPRQHAARALRSVSLDTDVGEPRPQPEPPQVVKGDGRTFSWEAANRGDILTLASLPAIWGLMIVTMQVVASHGMKSIEITFYTQLLTVPLFVATYLAARGGAGDDGGADADAGAAAARPAPFDPLVRRAGVALGSIWMLGGLIETSGFVAGASASHGAFLGQMSTLLVPLGCALRGDALNPKFVVACALAVPGIACFAFDSQGAGATSTLLGDALCALSAVMYSVYDLKLVDVGDKVRADVDELEVVHRVHCLLYTSPSPRD